ncbi:hypothetical protein [Staphylococcus phage vB_StaM_SA1]|nr:hypothetical protein [Staphylococcus phage vB_StaM_SA1]
MGFELSIYGINKSKQRELQWYLDYGRYEREKHHVFELYLNRPNELYKVFSSKSKKNQKDDEIIVISNEDLRELMISDLREDNFYYDLSDYYKLMSEITKIDRVKNDFYLILDPSF